MFLGVLQKKNATYLWRMLYLQGIFWILTAIATEVPSVVSLISHLLFIVTRDYALYLQGSPFYEHERCVEVQNRLLMCLLSLPRCTRSVEFGQ